MSVAKRGDGRFGVKFKGEEGRWGQRSFRPDEEAEAQQFDADCQYDQIENTQLTVLEAVDGRNSFRAAMAQAQGSGARLFEKHRTC